MTPDDETRNADRVPGARPHPPRPAPLSEQESLRKDMSYSPASETETQQKQREPLPDTIDDDIDADDVRVVPGTGGPDDVGDVDVDPAELNLPGPPSPKP